MSRVQTWKVSDELWAEIEPLIPTQEELRKTTSQKYQRKTGAGCKRKYDDRTYFEAIVYVLRTASFGTQFLANCSVVSVRRHCTTVFSVGQKRASLNEFGRQVCANTTS